MPSLKPNKLRELQQENEKPESILQKPTSFLKSTLFNFVRKIEDTRNVIEANIKLFVQNQKLKDSLLRMFYSEREEKAQKALQDNATPLSVMEKTLSPENKKKLENFLDEFDKLTKQFSTLEIQVDVLINYAGKNIQLFDKALMHLNVDNQVRQEMKANFSQGLSQDKWQPQKEWVAVHQQHTTYHYQNKPEVKSSPELNRVAQSLDNQQSLMRLNLAQTIYQQLKKDPQFGSYEDVFLKNEAFSRANNLMDKLNINQAFDRRYQNVRQYQEHLHSFYNETNTPQQRDMKVKGLVQEMEQVARNMDATLKNIYQLQPQQSPTPQPSFGQSSEVDYDEKDRHTRQVR